MSAYHCTSMLRAWRAAWITSDGFPSSPAMHVRRRYDRLHAVARLGEARPAVVGHARDAEIVPDEGEAALVAAELAVEGHARDALVRPRPPAVGRPRVRDVDELVLGIVALVHVEHVHAPVPRDREVRHPLVARRVVVGVDEDGRAPRPPVVLA